jgi:signal transduction histidine kinase
VRDHGPGIAAEEQEKVFQRFEQGRKAGMTADSGAGLGLGLYIVKQIVEAHGGRIELKSAPGQGASFTVTLPVQV